MGSENNIEGTWAGIVTCKGDAVRAQFNKRLKETLRARISSVIF